MLMNATELAEITGDWDYRTAPSNVEIEEGCQIERKQSLARFRSTRMPGLVLGRNVLVYTWTEFNVEPSGRVIVDEDSILVGAIFMCAEAISLGRRVIVSYNVTISDCDFHPHHPDDRKRDAIANAPQGDQSNRPKLITRPVVIEDDVWIGIGAIILKGVRIGHGARIGAGSVVTKSVPPETAVFGNPARSMPKPDSIP
jgi:acetyltransferase-like isoleucine patch superfamily enzyme